MAGFSVDAVVLNQKGHQLYVFGMNTEQLKQICYVTPRSHDDPEEIQRIIKPARAKDIGEYIKQANSLLPNSLVVSLTDEVSITSSGSPSTKIISFPDTEGKFAYILDGQHRLEGFKYSDGIEFDLPVVALYNADEALRGKVFADINSKQERVSDVLLLSIYYQIKDLPQETAAVMDVVTRLNTDPDSPLKGKVMTLEDDKGTWVRNNSMKQWLSPILASGGVLASKTVAEQTDIMKAYLKAIAKLWPDEWGNFKDYNLCRPTGFEIMFSVFPMAKTRCDLNCGRQYTTDNFFEQLKPIREVSIDIPGVGQFDLDWQRGKLAILSNRATRELMIKQLRDYLTAADE